MNTRVYRSELTPVAFLRRSAYVFPDKTAVVHGERRYSYRVFEERVNRLAWALRRAGLEKHDRVAFLCPNIPPLLEAHFAVPAAEGYLATPSEMPGAVVEPLFITDPFEASIAAGEAGQQAIALGITRAVDTFLGPGG